jgi:DNA-binding SARP family transcriptional activator
LALLLLHANEVASRDRLIDELWRDHAPETAANAVAALVSRLRRVLPVDVLVTRSGGYVASVEPDAIDLYRFERLVEEGSGALAAGAAAEAADGLRTALSLWRGPPLADFSYEPFAEAAIRRLEELRLAAVEKPHRRRLRTQAATPISAASCSRSCWNIHSGNACEAS